MAGGTGLPPIPKNERVLTRPIQPSAPGGVAPVSGQLMDFDSLSNARAWAEITQHGQRIAKGAFDYLDIKQYQSQIGWLAEESSLHKKNGREFRTKFPEDPDGFENAWQGYSDGILSEAPGWAIPHLRGVLAREGANNYNVILNRKSKAITDKSRQSTFDFMKETGEEVAVAAEAGELATPKALDAARTVSETANAAVTSGLISQVEADVEIGRMEHSTRRGMMLHRVRTAYAEGGPEAAQGTIDSEIGEFALEPADEGKLRSRASAEIEALIAGDTKSAVTQVRSEFEAGEARAREGVLMLAEGKLNSEWIDRHSDDLRPEDDARLRVALTTVPATASDPGLAAGLILAAARDPAGVLGDAVDGYVAGQLTPQARDQALLLATQSLNDAGRPWANDIRRQVAARVEGNDRILGALPEISGWLAANTKVTREEAQLRADAVIDQYDIADRKTQRATLPLPRFAGTSRVDMDDKALDTAITQVVQRAGAGGMSLSEIAAQGNLIAQWRRVTKES